MTLYSGFVTHQTLWRDDLRAGGGGTLNLGRDSDKAADPGIFLKSFFFNIDRLFFYIFNNFINNE